METHNASIFHCIACGRIWHAELDAVPPQCCGSPMVEACDETIVTDQKTDEPIKAEETNPSETTVDACVKDV